MVRGIHRIYTKFVIVRKIFLAFIIYSKGGLLPRFLKNKGSRCSDGSLPFSLWLIIIWNISVLLKLAALPDPGNCLSPRSRTAHCSSIVFGLRFPLTVFNIFCVFHPHNLSGPDTVQLFVIEKGNEGIDP